jgi:hypothetical protein
MVEPAKLLGLFAAGALTRHDLLIRLCQAATESSPKQIAAELPPDVLVQVREWSATPPASPDKCRVFGLVCAAGEYDWEGHLREESRRLHDGLWRWHGYFKEADQGVAQSASSAAHRP